MFYLIAIWAVVAWLLFRGIDSWFTSRRHAKEAERLGCKEPIVRPNPIPFAVDFIVKALKADRRQKFPEFMQSLSVIAGRMTYRHHILGNTGFSTCDPKNIQAVLATQFKDFGLGDRRKGIFRPLLGVGIFTADGRVWEHSRAMMRPQFNRDQVSDLDLEEKHVQNLMRALPTDASGWTQQTDLSPLFFRLTLDSACEFLFGESVDSQLANLPSQSGLPPKKHADVDEKAFTLSFDRGQGWLALRARFFDKYWIIDGPQARSDVAATHKFVDYFVRRALAHQSRSEKDLESAAEGKHKYVFLEALAEHTRNPVELRDQLLNILLAGRDTTASLLGWTFWLLARHPDIFNKLRASIINDFGPYDPINTSRLTFATLKNSTYLQYVINETLRLFPVVPGNFREALRDTTLPRGGGPNGDDPVFVPKGSQVDYSVFVMHRKTELWGPDAEEFKPERWAGRKIGWEYLPFNGGPRICIGQQFALTETSFVIARLLQRFDMVENMDEQIYATYNYTLTCCPARGVRVRFRESQSEATSEAPTEKQQQQQQQPVQF